MNPEHKYYKKYGLRSDRLAIFVQAGQKKRLESQIVNDTTIVTQFNPNKLAEVQVNCEIETEDGDFKGICHQRIYVGGMNKQGFSVKSFKVD